jgi:hypothetical protein
MTDERRLGRPFFGDLRMAAVIALGVGVAGSAGFMLYAGQRVSAPGLLRVLFVGWVISPFVMLAVGHLVSQRWAARTRATLHGVTLVVTVSSLAIYGAAACGASRPKTAVFVLVAPVSWLLMAIAVATAAFLSRGVSGRADGSRPHA